MASASMHTRVADSLGRRVAAGALPAGSVVNLGFAVPALARAGEATSVAERLEHAWRPVSAGVAVPVFALFAAGVGLGADELGAALTDPVAQGVALGLVVGKPLGIVVATALLVRCTGAALDPSFRWGDLVAVAVVAGVGFTVSLLIGELSYGPGSPHAAAAKAAVLVGSLTAGVLGAVLLTWRSRAHRGRAGAGHPAPADLDRRPAQPPVRRGADPVD